MIKINTSDFDRFSVEVASLSDKSEDKIKEVLKNSAFNIESKAKKNINSNKSVKHPGSKAKPYLIPAFEKEKDQFLEKLKEVIEW